MDDYGKVEIILTAVRDPVAQKMYRELSGFAWIRLHSVAVRYPVENQRILINALRKSDGKKAVEGVSWVIDAQTVAQIGALLARGESPQRRVVAIGGPGCTQPKHYSLCAGTRLDTVISELVAPEPQAVLRGGLLTGSPIDPHLTSVNYDDDGFFFLPEAVERQMVTFLRPGFDRTSAFPSFAGSLLGKADRHITASLRGESRPCISCAMCEKICPVEIMPQVIHRYLYRDMLEEAQKAGMERCIDCNLCTFVCPSKIDLREDFEAARAQILEEQNEADR
jgi:Na+-transporting NADH:ubiquinone oxidoreductase subunit A